MIEVRLRFGIQNAYLGDDVNRWDKETFDYRQQSSPGLLVQIQFEDGRKTKVFLHELQFVGGKDEARFMLETDVAIDIASETGSTALIDKAVAES
jgi:hypothetical protein